MHKIQQHIAFKFTTLLLVLTLLTPSVVKFAHIFSHHKHEVCNGEAKTHLHTLDVDCTFHKFQINTAFSLPENTYQFFEKQDNHLLINSQYYFISEFQQLLFNLRGPPINS